MSTVQFQELGPIDYIVLESAGDQPVTGEVMPLLLDLVDRGVIRILDLAFLVKAEDGSVAAIDLAEVAAQDTGLAEFEGASSGLLGQDDLEEAATALEPGTVAGVLVLGEPLGRARRHRASPLRWSARRERTHPHSGDRRRARRPRNHRLIRKNTLPCVRSIRWIRSDRRVVAARGACRMVAVTRGSLAGRDPWRRRVGQSCTRRVPRPGGLLTSIRPPTAVTRSTSPHSRIPSRGSRRRSRRRRSSPPMRRRWRRASR